MKNLLIVLVLITVVILSFSSCAPNDGKQSVTSENSSDTPTFDNTTAPIEVVSLYEKVYIGMSIEEYESLVNRYMSSNRSYQKCTHFDFWLDANGKNIVLQKEYNQNESIVKSITAFDAVNAKKDDFSKLDVGMSVEEMVELVGIPYLYNPALSSPVVEYITLDGTEYQIGFIGDKISKIQELNSDFEGALTYLENSVGATFSLDNFKLKRIYLTEKSSDSTTPYRICIEGIHGDENTEWKTQLLVLEKYAYEYYYDFNNHYIIYNTNITEEYDCLVTRTKTLFMNDLANSFETGRYEKYLE